MKKTTATNPANVILAIFIFFLIVVLFFPTEHTISFETDEETRGSIENILEAAKYQERNACYNICLAMAEREDHLQANNCINNCQGACTT